MFTKTKIFIRDRFFIITNQRCKVEGHDWKFAYNHGVAMGDSRSLDQLLKDIKLGKAFGVYKCSVCGHYSHNSDGLGRNSQFPGMTRSES